MGISTAAEAASRSPRECPDMIAEGASVADVQPLAVSIRTAADMVSVSERTMASLVASGEIATVRVGTRRVVPVTSLTDWMAEKIANQTSLATQ